MKTKLPLVLMALWSLASFAQVQNSIKPINANAQGLRLTSTERTEQLLRAPAGCLTAANGQLPATTFMPVCLGNMQKITAEAYAGQYSKVRLIANTPYTFTVSKSDYQITIADENGVSVLAGGTGSATFTPTTSRTVRFYSHTNSSCGSGDASTIHTRSVGCESVTETAYGCNQDYVGMPEYGSNIAKHLNMSVANDFFVPKEANQFALKTMTVELVPLAAAAAADLVSFDVVIMADNGHKAPGAEIKRWTGVVPTKTETLSYPNVVFTTISATLDLEQYELPVNPAESTRYWISLQATSASPESIYWISYPYQPGSTSAPTYNSIDNGLTYSQVTSEIPGLLYDSNWTLDAECATAAVSEATSRSVTFFPNPVRDILTLNSKSKVESVHIYNIAGQKMPISAKPGDGRINLSKLAPGTYIISTILEGGKNESFKIIKQ